MPGLTTSIMQPTIKMSPKVDARIAGVLYLIVIIFGGFAELGVRARLVVLDNPASTAHNIMAHQTLYRVGLASEIFYLACNVPLTVIFYSLFKVVNQKVALLEAIF